MLQIRCVINVTCGTINRPRCKWHALINWPQCLARRLLQCNLSRSGCRHTAHQPVSGLLAQVHLAEVRLLAAAQGVERAAAAVNSEGWGGPASGRLVICNQLFKCHMLQKPPVGSQPLEEQRRHSPRRSLRAFRAPTTVTGMFRVVSPATVVSPSTTLPGALKASLCVGPRDKPGRAVRRDAGRPAAHAGRPPLAYPLERQASEGWSSTAGSADTAWLCQVASLAAETNSTASSGGDENTAAACSTVQAAPLTKRVWGLVALPMARLWPLVEMDREVGSRKIWPPAVLMVSLPAGGGARGWGKRGMARAQQGGAAQRQPGAVGTDVVDQPLVAGASHTVEAAQGQCSRGACCPYYYYTLQHAPCGPPPLNPPPRTRNDKVALGSIALQQAAQGAALHTRGKPRARMQHMSHMCATACLR